MTQAYGSFYSFRYIEEVTPGVTPSTPSMKELRVTPPVTAKLSREQKKTNEMRPDGQITNVRLMEKRVAAKLNFEFSFGEYDSWLESALRGAWATNVLKAGTTDKSFTGEGAHTDVDVYGVFTGLFVNAMTLDIKSNDFVTGSFDIVGMGASPLTGTPLDANPTASLTNPQYAGFDAKTVKEGGATTSIITGISLNLQRNANANFALGSESAIGVGYGENNLTGTISAYFENLTLANKFLNETETSLEFTLGNGTSKSYTFLIPRLKLGDGGLPEVTSAGVIIPSLPFQALYDSVEATNLKITRIPGA